MTDAELAAMQEIERLVERSKVFFALYRTDDGGLIVRDSYTHNMFVLRAEQVPTDTAERISEIIEENS